MVDLVLGLPWIQRHKPRVNWVKLCYEFTQNRDKYYLYLYTPLSNIKIVEANNFLNFIDNKTNLYFL